jgi:hypothetical protein
MTTFDSEFLKDRSRWTKAGKAGLKHIHARESGKQKPVFTKPVRKREADQDHKGCKSQYGFVQIHGFVPYACFLLSQPQFLQAPQVLMPRMA